MKFLNLPLVLTTLIERAWAYRGSTYPNPPVGAVLLSHEGEVLSLQVHQKRGQAHAEAAAIIDARDRGVLAFAHTLIVTLEPCNHQGMTPPCTQAILGTPIRSVIYLCEDPNPRVAGGGAVYLREKGLEVLSLTSYGQQEGVDVASWVKQAHMLIQPFAHKCVTGRPWITVKRAFRKLEDGEWTMTPPDGIKTFSSKAALDYAHQLRRQSQAIITGSGTVLADNPLFTVRRVEDFANQDRWLILCDRRRRVCAEWLDGVAKRGFKVYLPSSLEDLMDFLIEQDLTEVLVEGGHTVSQALLEAHMWDELIDIFVESDNELVKKTLRNYKS